MRCCVFFFYCFFLRRKAQFGMQHPMLPGAWGEQPHKTNPPHESTLAPFSKRNRLYFIKNFRRILCPQGHLLGLNALRLRGGMGATQALISDESLRMCEAFMPARASFGMQHPMLPGAWGEQPHKSNPPHESTLAPFSKRNRLYFIKNFRRILCP